MNKRISNFFGIALIAKFVLVFMASTAVAGNYDKAPSKDIVDTAVAAGQFETLAAALGAAGLVDTLKGDGPFTVFAPTDAAFAKLPEGTVESLLKPENRDQLVSILTYHVVPGRVLAKDVVELERAKTVEGSSVRIDASAKGVKIDESRLLKADILCSNGVIHVVDSVLMPPPKPLKAARAREQQVGRPGRLARVWHQESAVGFWPE